MKGPSFSKTLFALAACFLIFDFWVVVIKALSKSLRKPLCLSSSSSCIFASVPTTAVVFSKNLPVREEGRARTYIHADSINNCVIGAYAGISDGTDVFNHPQDGDPSVIIDPEAMEPTVVEAKKLPILIGLEAVVGAQCLLNSGSVIGAGARVPNRSVVEGLVYLDESGNQHYVDARPDRRTL